MKGRTIGLTVFFFGLLMILYPFISQGYYEGQFRREASLFHEQTPDEKSRIAYQTYINYNRSHISRVEEIETADVSRVSSEEPIIKTDEIDFSNTDILGSISIPRINLLYPIYDGATDENLMKGVARVEGTSYPVGGLNTNSVIAGHTGVLNHVFFTNINQLKMGDKIIIQNKMEMLTYEVYKTSVVYPDEVSALAVVPSQDTLTLLTCTFDSTQRLLVYAKRVPNNIPEQSMANQTENQVISEYTSSKTEPIGAFLQNYHTAMLIFILGNISAYFIFIRN